ncbi:MAG: GNAT family N-acetyltransferase [Phenylobacterium sp.]|uniref:GNAT family N-acetyltransferase n=1 Tax=Phenylobacterium sp. TaxID=1871053 RepID=UPI002736CFFD|nr:GNAT family N-acetyltransferase [Phenylobacterium sp.]MDP1641430.1 GNAT family N-acetyltransferase [Phenylobacterium sp.]MDP3118632.1 GNAT family N-acetyltransferase [Phenylobacterium sp.]
MSVPHLEGEGVSIRPQRPADIEDCCRLYQEIGWDEPGLSPSVARAQRQAWLDWAIRNEAQLAALHQPPYGDRVICDADGAFAGMIGIVPRLEPFGRLPSQGGDPAARLSPEVGLFWALRPAWQGRGLATAAAKLLSDWMFAVLGLQRIVAGTEYGNAASIAVMRRLDMRLERNPSPEPPWFQISGSLEAPKAEERNTSPPGPATASARL